MHWLASKRLRSRSRISLSRRHSMMTPGRGPRSVIVAACHFIRRFRPFQAQTCCIFRAQGVPKLLTNSPKASTLATICQYFTDRNLLVSYCSARRICKLLPSHLYSLRVVPQNLSCFRSPTARQASFVKECLVR